MTSKGKALCWPDMREIYFVAAVLAVYCVSLFVSKLAGPGGIFTKLRRSARGSVKDGLSCGICAGTWVAALVVSFMAYRGHLPWIELPLWIFAVAGANALVHLFDPV